MLCYILYGIETILSESGLHSFLLMTFLRNETHIINNLFKFSANIISHEN